MASLPNPPTRASFPTAGDGPGSAVLSFCWMLFALGSIACLGCVGDIGSTSDREGSEPTKDPPSVCAESTGRVVARRLSRSQYTNTLRHLFPELDVGSRGQDLPADAAGANGLTVSDYFFQKHETIATEIADLAVKEGFITCNPSIDAPACAREVFEPFMERAWRRPVTEEEVDSALAYLEVVESESVETNKFEQAIRLGIQYVLMAPDFLFRFEPVADVTSSEPQPLGNFEMACRLSYFIYRSMPDDELFDAARAGKLTDPQELEAQFDRMLSNPKSGELVDRLLAKWLAVDQLDQFNPDPLLYPDYDEELRDSMKQELSLFVKEFITEDRNFRDMLDADFTYLNDRLAKHYGVPGTFSSDFTRVSLSDVPQRGGLLTQGAVLAATSVPHNDPTALVTETSIIFRGTFVLNRVACSPMPPPPDDLDINQLLEDSQEDIPDTAPRKEREGIRQSMPECAVCHSFIDPIGYSMEHYDVTGAWRDFDSFDTKVDATGVLKGSGGVDVGSFDGARELGTLLKSTPHLANCLIENVLRQALERELNKEDQCAVDTLAQHADQNGNGLRSLLLSIVKSRPFTHQQGEAL